MPRIELAPEVIGDFDRFVNHLTEHGAKETTARIAEILDALEVLGHSPLIGRRVRGGKRELVIGRASRGYVALYRFVARLDIVVVLAIRSQREAGYARISRT